MTQVDWMTQEDDLNSLNNYKSPLQRFLVQPGYKKKLKLRGEKKKDLYSSSLQKHHSKWHSFQQTQKNHNLIESGDKAHFKNYDKTTSNYHVSNLSKQSLSVSKATMHKGMNNSNYRVRRKIIQEKQNSQSFVENAESQNNLQKMSGFHLKGTERSLCISKHQSRPSKSRNYTSEQQIKIRNKCKQSPSSNSVHRPQSSFTNINASKINRQNPFPDQNSSKFITKMNNQNNLSQVIVNSPRKDSPSKSHFLARKVTSFEKVTNFHDSLIKKMKQIGKQSKIITILKQKAAQERSSQKSRLNKLSNYDKQNQSNFRRERNRKKKSFIELKKSQKKKAIEIAQRAPQTLMFQRSSTQIDSKEKGKVKFKRVNSILEERKMSHELQEEKIELVSDEGGMKLKDSPDKQNFPNLQFEKEISFQSNLTDLDSPEFDSQHASNKELGTSKYLKSDRDLSLTVILQESKEFIQKLYEINPNLEPIKQFCHKLEKGEIKPNQKDQAKEIKTFLEDNWKQIENQNDQYPTEMLRIKKKILKRLGASLNSDKEEKSSLKRGIDRKKTLSQINLPDFEVRKRVNSTPHKEMEEKKLNSEINGMSNISIQLEIEQKNSPSVKNQIILRKNMQTENDILDILNPLFTYKGGDAKKIDQNSLHLVNEQPENISGYSNSNKKDPSHQSSVVGVSQHHSSSFSNTSNVTHTQNLDISIDVDGCENVNQYILKNTLGKGAFGTVRRAKSRIDHKDYVNLIA